MTSFVGSEQLSAALYGCHLVLIPAGVPRKPGMTRDDLFNINAGMDALTVHTPPCIYPTIGLFASDYTGRQLLC